MIYPIIRNGIPDLVINPVTHNDYIRLDNLYLYGSSMLSSEENTSLFKTVYSYILATKRFEIA